MRSQKSWYPGIIFVSLHLLWGCAGEPASNVSDVLAGPFLNQPFPGDTAVIFAPGLVSLEGRYEYGMSFSPEG